ncbi:hypothetical protein GOP47_0016812 [Adiantum capillus-veneris]|uniref:Heterokaryon incompatibility domain-containing protein n=1 Tax=Adiantum capillus-veneris TaxID=13818 RepID=A0A9D4ZC21_ADICA|nr:hypothetical protein GOP47_0016812 [Adiantum capillus-veneris]
MDGRVDFNTIFISRCRDEMAAKSSLADNGVFPIRVIDLKDTFDSKGGIAFTVPNDWSFHTISHTWSMEIRKFSEEVGIAVKEERNLEYNQVFKQKKLDHCPAYSHLLEFLEILRSDGVERVWFDALCINQVDNSDKSHEIVHMGAFYFHSLGCYVAAHGFGRGFGMTDDNHRLPRWFSRVWTFQEFLLPKRLTFVVEMGRLDLHTAISMLRARHLMGSCECKGEAESLLWEWGSEAMACEIKGGDTAYPPLGTNWLTRDMRDLLARAVEDADAVRALLSRAVEGGDEVEFWRIIDGNSGGYNRCMHGRFQRIIRSVNDTDEELEKRMYLIDRDTYIYVLSRMKDESRKDVLITQMLMRFWVVCSGGLPAIVREISLRACSNDEDRVLSVLGLLGLDGKLRQLRTGQTLDEQIVQMCNAMAKNNLCNLITLCAAFMRPYVSAASSRQSPCRGLSWAPHFLAPPGNYLLEFVLEQTDFLHRAFRLIVVTAGITSRGSLSLTCYILKGRLLPLLQHAKQCLTGSNFFNLKVGCYACLDLPEFADTFVLEIIHGHALCLNASSSFNATASSELSLIPQGKISLAQHHVAENYFEGAMNLDIEANGMRWGTLPDTVEFNVWLLLLGTIRRKLPFTDLNRLVLVFMMMAYAMCAQRFVR